MPYWSNSNMYTRREKSLTGRVRFRIGLFGRLIPQIEEQVKVYRDVPKPPAIKGYTPPSDEDWKKHCYRNTVYKWRDMTVSDLMNNQSLSAHIFESTTFNGAITTTVHHHP